MGATGNASVANHVQPVAHGIHDLGKLVERGSRPVKLTSAMIGDHYSGGADVQSTPRVSTSKFAARQRSIMLFVRPRSLWKYNWKSFGVLIVEPISSTPTVPKDEIPNIVPNFWAALATALSPS